MKLLILGGTGQLGRELLLQAGSHRPAPDRAGPDRAGHDRAGPDRAGPDRAGPDRAGSERNRPDQVASDLVVTAPTRAELDLAAPGGIEALVAAQEFDAIVNAAAYTAVDRAESERDLAAVLNAVVPGRLAAAAAARNIPLVHVSTDYVFDGRKGAPYGPDDPVAPLGVYGASKEAGERAVRAAGGRASPARCVILRTAWVYSPFGGNFLKTMLRLGGERDVLKVVDDQRGTPTAAADLAAACLSIARHLAAHPDEPGGTFHFTNAGETTWCGFARAIFEIAGPRLPRTPQVQAITTAEYPTPAQRPADSRLDCTATLARFPVVQPGWRDALAATLDRLL